MKLFILLINNEYVAAYNNKDLALQKVKNLLEYATNDDLKVIIKEVSPTQWETRYIFDGVQYVQSTIKIIEDDLIEAVPQN